VNRWVAALAFLAVAGLDPFSIAEAQFQKLRKLPDEDVQTAIKAVLADPSSPLSEDPSCKVALSDPKPVPVAEGLAVALVRAATNKKPILVQVDCFVRQNYPLGPGEEYCRLTFLQPGRPRAFGYGLVFVMDWPRKAIRPGSVECY
jgi:hypothetical protein